MIKCKTHVQAWAVNLSFITLSTVMLKCTQQRGLGNVYLHLSDTVFALSLSQAGTAKLTVSVMK